MWLHQNHHHLTRSGILFLSQFPWRHLYDDGDDGSFLNITGFSREAFEKWHEFLYLGHQNHRDHGRPRLINTRDELGITLFYVGSKMRLSELCLIFDCTPDIINH